MAQASALPLVSATALVSGGAPERGPALLHALGLGLLNVVSVVALYRAFAVGPLSVVAPIASSYAAVTVALAFMLGDPPAPGLMIGLVAVAAGVVVVAAARGAAAGERPRSRGAGVAWAALASAAFGAVFFWLEPIAGELGPVWPIALMRAAGVVALGLLRGVQPAAPGRVPLPLLAACVLLDTGGLVFYTLGARLAGAALVAVLASLSAVIAVLLAHLRLRERLSAAQWVGVALVLAGTAWISGRSHLG